LYCVVLTEVQERSAGLEQWRRNLLHGWHFLEEKGRRGGGDIAEGITVERSERRVSKSTVLASLEEEDATCFHGWHFLEEKGRRGGGKQRRKGGEEEGDIAEEKASKE